MGAARRPSAPVICVLFALGLVNGALDSSANSSCDAGAFTRNVASSYNYGGATLTPDFNDPSGSDLYGVKIRNRRRLVYSSRAELPETIGGPTSARFPLVAHANATIDGAASIVDYAHATRSLLEGELSAHGAVYLRGLPLTGSDDLSEFIAALGWNNVKLGGGGTQRSEVQKNVRSASDEPPEQTIEPHGDMAHSVQHPTHISFFCADGPPPGVGGETVLTNMRGVYSDLEASGIVAQFAERGGVAYRKRLWSSAETNHTSYTWQKFFFTEDLEEALTEVRKRDPNAVANEHAPGVIDFREVLPAVRPHPSTGEPVWFNGVHTNHKSYYIEAEHVDTSDGSPMDTSYADGTEIPDEIIAQVRGAVWRNSVAVRLQKGDLVFVDNYFAWHGRMSWVQPNPRKVLLTHYQQPATAAA